MIDNKHCMKCKNLTLTGYHVGSCPHSSVLKAENCKHYEEKEKC
jgi:hypothetical protein